MRLIEITECCDDYGTECEYMQCYIDKYGYHFNEKLFDFAVKHLMKNGLPIQVMAKDRVDTVLTLFNTELNHDVLYDAAYTANMCRACYSTTIPDELHMCRFIKETLDCENSYDGMLFNRWCCDMQNKDIEIDWLNML